MNSVLGVCVAGRGINGTSPDGTDWTTVCNEPVVQRVQIDNPEMLFDVCGKHLSVLMNHMYLGPGEPQ